MAVPFPSHTAISGGQASKAPALGGPVTAEAPPTPRQAWEHLQDVKGSHGRKIPRAAQLAPKGPPGPLFASQIPMYHTILSMATLGKTVWYFFN